MNSDTAYAGALAYLYGLTNWETRPREGMREQLLLERPAALLAALDNPQRRYRTILIAGTKGKGSTAVLLAGILRAAGLRTGLYTQPHLHTFRERIRLGGRLIARDEFAAGVSRLQPLVARLARERPALGPLTTYEVSTALALDYFSRGGVQVAVLEVGLGGRLDALNVVEQDLAIFTSISLDHMAILGQTLPEIAREKAGLVKPGTPVLSAPQRAQVLEVLERAAAGRSAPLGLGGRDWDWTESGGALSVKSAGPRSGLWDAAWRHDGLRVPLLGAHQLENAATAVAAGHVLAVPPEAVAQGLAAVRWPARMEVVYPPSAPGVTIVIDGAHNGDSAEKLAAALRANFRFERMFLVLGVGADKDLPALIAPLAPLTTRAWACAAHHPLSRPVAEVARGLQEAGVAAEEAANVEAALGGALAASGAGGLVCVTGSLRVAAEAREALGLVSAGERDPD